MNTTINQEGKKLFPHLFSPLTIGPLSVPNRVFFPPMEFNRARTNGTISKHLYDFYLSLAQSGCGIIYTGAATTTPDNPAFKYTMKMYTKRQADSYKHLCREIKQRGSVPAIQLANFGLQSTTLLSGKPVCGPSPVPCMTMKKIDPYYRIKQMTIEDIQKVIKEFIDSALLAYEAGFEIIQVHAAHGYLLSSFLSPYTNLRTDDYGGTPENRVRIILEIIKGIRQQIGDRAVIDIRINGTDLLEDNGTRPEDFTTYIPLLEEAGIDMINISGGTIDTLVPIYGKPVQQNAPYIEMVQKIKSYTGLAVGHAGWIDSLTTGEQLVKNKQLDMAGLGRVQYADPFYIKKTVKGTINKINRCTWCGKCFYDLMDPYLLKSYCTVNPDFKRPNISGIEKTVKNILFYLILRLIKIKQLTKKYFTGC